MNKLKTGVLMMLVLMMTGCGKHFITDRNYRKQVEKDFAGREALLPEMRLDSLTREEREAMEFLYAYMPYSDLADYEPEFFLEQVRYALATREEFGWNVPEDVFRHFVLVYRVNNEDLDTARMLMFHELKDRVKGLTMEEAALEVNHWCHEHVAYRAADIRTSAPLATMRTSLGRCGEESTFAVTALRAVGIPARQCYTPRWAHCDDNHAWVEVWIDGTWKFLGACEPDPRLDMGWFAVPSTRCMMVHTKAFGRYHGNEEVVKETSLYSELNLLEHYAPTARITVAVLDEKEQAVKGAHVMFKLYNYAEYYTLADILTDEEGKASLTTGLGDLLVWATDGEHYNYRKMDVRKEKEITIYLTREAGQAYVEDLTIVPPVAGEAKVSPTPEELERNASRIAYEDSLREAYMATFQNYTLKENQNLTPEQAADIMKRSEGNYKEISTFLNNHTEKVPGLYLYDYMMSYSDKDLRDIEARMLEAHLTFYDGKYPLEVWKKGLMPARISNELVRDWRGLKEIKTIRTDDTGNYYNCPISPLGVAKLGVADPHSRDIYFVAANRATGTPAYLDNATNTIYIWNGRVWEKVQFEGNSGGMTQKLTLTYAGKDPEVPVYYPHFTLQKYENGTFVSFDFEGDPRMERFPAEIAVEPGYYCLSTGRRLEDGSVLSRMEFFTIEKDAPCSMPIVLRSGETGTLDGQPRLDADMEIYENLATLEDYAGESGMLFCFLGDWREPSKHLVKELQALQKEWKAWGGMTYLVAPREAGAEVQQLVNTDYIAAGPHNGMENRISRILNEDIKGDYPWVVLVNRRGEVLFSHHGYRIGLAEMILSKAAK